MDNVGIVVDDLGGTIDFFRELGLELEGRATIEGEWAGRVTGLADQRVEIAMMRTPDGHVPGSGSGESRMLSQQELRSGMITGYEQPTSFLSGRHVVFLSIQTSGANDCRAEQSLFLDCLNTKLFKSLETVLHGFEFFGGMPLPIHDFAYDTKRILRAV